MPIPLIGDFYGVFYIVWPIKFSGPCFGESDPRFSVSDPCFGESGLIMEDQVLLSEDIDPCFLSAPAFSVSPGISYVFSAAWLN